MSPLWRLVCVALVAVLLTAAPAESRPAQADGPGEQPAPSPRRPHLLGGLADRIAGAGNVISKGIEAGAERIRERVHGHVGLVTGKTAPSTTEPSRAEVPLKEPEGTASTSSGSSAAPSDLSGPRVESLPIADIIGASTVTPDSSLDVGASTTPAAVDTTPVESKNLIRAPPRCSPGMKSDSNGRCRDVY